MDIHRHLGHGFLEAVYQEALSVELAEREIPYQREVELRINYKGKPLHCLYRADFLCFDSIIVETKAISKLTGVEEAQILNQLKATGFRRGLLINFGSPNMEVKRFVQDDWSKNHVRNLRESAQSADDSLEITL